MSEIILINVSGKDKPGLTSEMTSIMAQYDIRILDIGQAVIHEHLTWGILVEVPSDKESSSVLKDLLFRMHELEQDVSFKPVSKEEYQYSMECSEDILDHSISKKHVKIFYSSFYG